MTAATAAKLLAASLPPSKQVISALTLLQPRFLREEGLRFGKNDQNLGGSGDVDMYARYGAFQIEV